MEFAGSAVVGLWGLVGGEGQHIAEALNEKIVACGLFACK